MASIPVYRLSRTEDMRVRLVKHGEPIKTGADTTVLCDSSIVHSLMCDSRIHLHSEHDEFFYAIMCSDCGFVYSIIEISRGSYNNAPMNSRDVMTAALLTGASACVVIHNHPSGCDEPSTNDDDATKQLVKMLKCIGVKLLDSYIVATKELGYSYIENKPEILGLKKK